MSLQDPMLGKELGNYRLESKLGRGACGVVYRGQHIKLGTPFAVKILHPALAENEESAERFLREAQTAARLHHENVVFIADFDIEAGVGPYFVMEYLDGRSLRECLDLEAPFSAKRIASICEQICQPLAWAHRNGIIHRDLKPENIYLLPRPGREQVKILDFGIAKITGGASSQLRDLTRSGRVLGTPRYVSPEQAQGKEINHRTDIYAFGIILYEMLTGYTPFNGQTPEEMIIQHLTVPPPPLDPERFPDGLQDLMDWLLAKSPKNRPDDMNEVWALLKEALPLIRDDSFEIGRRATPIPYIKHTASKAELLAYPSNSNISEYTESHQVNSNDLQSSSHTFTLGRDFEKLNSNFPLTEEEYDYLDSEETLHDPSVLNELRNTLKYKSDRYAQNASDVGEKTEYTQLSYKDSVTSSQLSEITSAHQIVTDSSRKESDFAKNAIHAPSDVTDSNLEQKQQYSELTALGQDASSVVVSWHDAAEFEDSFSEFDKDIPLELEDAIDSNTGMFSAIRTLDSELENELTLGPFSSNLPPPNSLAYSSPRPSEQVAKHDLDDNNYLLHLPPPTPLPPSAQLDSCEAFVVVESDLDLLPPPTPLPIEPSQTGVFATNESANLKLTPPPPLEYNSEELSISRSGSLESQAYSSINELEQPSEVSIESILDSILSVNRPSPQSSNQAPNTDSHGMADCYPSIKRDKSSQSITVKQPGIDGEIVYGERSQQFIDEQLASSDNPWLSPPLELVDVQEDTFRGTHPVSFETNSQNSPSMRCNNKEAYHLARALLPEVIAQKLGSSPQLQSVPDVGKHDDDPTNISRHLVFPSGKAEYGAFASEEEQNTSNGRDLGHNRSSDDNSPTLRGVLSPHRMQNEVWQSNRADNIQTPPPASDLRWYQAAAASQTDLPAIQNVAHSQHNQVFANKDAVVDTVQPEIPHRNNNSTSGKFIEQLHALWQSAYKFVDWMRLSIDRPRHPLVFVAICLLSGVLLWLLYSTLFSSGRRNLDPSSEQVHRPCISQVRIDTKPSAAAIWLGSQKLGLTPYIHRSECAKGVTFRFQLDQYQDQSQILHLNEGESEVTIPLTKNLQISRLLKRTIKTKKPNTRRHHKIRLTTQPARVKVFYKKHLICRTPCQLRAPRSTIRTYRLQKRGYYHHTINIRFSGKQHRHFKLRSKYRP